MQSVSRGGQMIIGKVLYEELSGEMQQIFKKEDLDQIKWNYHNLAEKKPYQIYNATFWSKYMYVNPNDVSACEWWTFDANTSSLAYA